MAKANRGGSLLGLLLAMALVFAGGEAGAEEAKTHFKRGTEKLQQGQWQEAIKDYDKAIELDPQDAITYYNRGLVKYELGQEQEAMVDFYIAIVLDPELAKEIFDQ